MVTFQFHGGVGDEVCLTSTIREYHKKFPDEMIKVSLTRPSLLLGNPHINRGNLDNGITVFFYVHMNEHIGNHGHSYALQLATKLGVSFRVVDTTPELFFSDDEKNAARESIASLRLPSGPIVTMCTQATWKNRTWPLVCYSAVARILRDKGINVIEIGAGNQETGEASASFMSKLTVRQTAAIQHMARAHIGSDSGLSHMAAAAGTPQVTIYSVKRWYTRAYWNTTPLFSYSDCMKTCEQSNSYCGRRVPGCYDIKHCMNEISPAEVVEAVLLSFERFR